MPASRLPVPSPLGIGTISMAMKPSCRVLPEGSADLRDTTLPVFACYPQEHHNHYLAYYRPESRKARLNTPPALLTRSADIPALSLLGSLNAAQERSHLFI
ncbi:hypothetical protein BRAO285_2590002 [Bradyrhizobium sp. ORS 285]|nr:hypothetical protein BRAO285_2590002 [Bradyrhizobium sp. ORS 285]